MRHSETNYSRLKIFLVLGVIFVVPSSCSDSNFSSNTKTKERASANSGASPSPTPNSADQNSDENTDENSSEVGVDDSGGVVSKNFELTVQAPTGGVITSQPEGITCPSTCVKSFANQSKITLSAVPSAGFVFKSWGDGVCKASGSNATCVFTISEATTVTAIFEAIPKQLCTINKIYSAFVQCGFPTSAQGLKSGSTNLTLPADAVEISLRITEISVDDYKPTLYMNNQLIFSKDETLQAAHWITGLNIDVSNRLNPGNNLVGGSVYDAFGTCVQVAPRIVGSYKAASCESSLYP